MAITIGKPAEKLYLRKIEPIGMNTLIVDCGATKTDWYLSGGRSLRTAGFNLAQTPAEQLQAILDQAAAQLGPVDRVHFYAAGLVSEPPVRLERWFAGATVEYASDMLGAARAVCGHAPGIAAILGTGANTCQYDGEKITRKVNCGGFIVGDEGSAAVLGKRFVTDYLKGFVPQSMADAFAHQFQADYPTLVKNIYAGQAPARYLGGFAPFILSYYSWEEYAKDLVDNNFREFFRRTVKQYDALPLGIVGGFGHACKDILSGIGREFGIQINTILASPLEGLRQYHGI